MTPPIRVLIADDHALVRAGFTMILEAEVDIEVVGAACDGEEAVARATLWSPDVVLMDVQMPGTDGIEATGLITSTLPDCRVLILTTFDDDDYLFAALRAGASGFLLKNCPPDDLVSAIRVVAQGHSLLAPEVTHRVIARSTSGGAARTDDRVNDLTDRERGVLIEMSHGLSNAEIAASLYVSEATVKSHVSRVLTKFGVRDRVQAVIVAHESGLMGDQSR